MPDTTYTQGTNFYSPQTGQNQGTVNYDPNTGARLNQGQQVNYNPNIVSSTSAQNSLNQNGAALDKYTGTPDPYEQYLNNKLATQQAAQTADKPSVEEQNDAFDGSKLQSKATSDYGAYKAGLETLGIQSGLSQNASGLQADKMVNAANSETQKLSDI